MQILDNNKSKEIEEVIFITSNLDSHNISNISNKEQEEVNLQCKFIFKDTQTLYSIALKDLLYSLLYTAYNNFLFECIFTREVSDNNEFHIYIKSTSTKILNFSNYISEYLPTSIDFTFVSIIPLDLLEFNTIKELVDSKTLDIYNNNRLKIPNVKELNSILRDGKFSNISLFIEIIKSDLNQENLELNIQSNPNIIKAIISNLAIKLLESKCIFLQRNNNIIGISLLPQDYASLNKENATPFVLFADLDSAQNFLRLNQSQKNILTSFEKPFINTNCKEIFFEEFKTYNIFASLSNDLILLLLLSYLKEKYNIEYLFFNKNMIKKDIQPSLYYNDAYPNIDNPLLYLYSVSEEIYISHFRKNKSLLEILNVNKCDNSRFIAFLSTKNDSAFLIEYLDNDSRFSKILNISFECDLIKQLKILNNYKNGNKLIRNFIKNNTDIINKWNFSKNDLELLNIGDIVDIPPINNISNYTKNINISNNLIDIFSLISSILDLKTNVLFEANRCVRDRGPRIDYKLKRDGDFITIDYARILRSVMSFQLAGVEHELLCYGVVDSLAEFIGTLSSDMFVNYGISNVFLCGDLLLEQCFLDKILKYIPKNMQLSLPIIGSVDYLA